MAHRLFLDAGTMVLKLTLTLREYHSQCFDRYSTKLHGTLHI